jgi:hypothetical protein
MAVVLATGSKIVRREGAGFAQRQQAVDTLALGIAADFVVELGAHLADLAHVAEHQDLSADGRREDVDAGAHRVRVGVVGVVQQHRPVQG